MNRMNQILLTLALLIGIIIGGNYIYEQYWKPSDMTRFEKTIHKLSEGTKQTLKDISDNF